MLMQMFIGAHPVANVPVDPLIQVVLSGCRHPHCQQTRRNRNPTSQSKFHWYLPMRGHSIKCRRAALLDSFATVFSLPSPGPRFTLGACYQSFDQEFFMNRRVWILFVALGLS